MHLFFWLSLLGSGQVASHCGQLLSFRRPEGRRPRRMNSSSTDWPRFPAQQQVRGWREGVLSFRSLGRTRDRREKGCCMLQQQEGGRQSMKTPARDGPGPAECLSSWSSEFYVLSLLELA